MPRAHLGLRDRGGLVRAPPAGKRFRIDPQHEGIGNLDLVDHEGDASLGAAKVRERLQRGQGTGPCRVHHGGADAIPAPAVDPRSLSGEGLRRVTALDDPECPHQVLTPCSIRPRSASTARVPASVAASASGTAPPHSLGANCPICENWSSSVPTAAMSPTERVPHAFAEKYETGR